MLLLSAALKLQQEKLIILVIVYWLFNIKAELLLLEKQC